MNAIAIDYALQCTRTKILLETERIKHVAVPNNRILESCQFILADYSDSLKINWDPRIMSVNS